MAAVDDDHVPVGIRSTATEDSEMSEDIDIVSAFRALANVRPDVATGVFKETQRISSLALEPNMPLDDKEEEPETREDMAEDRDEEALEREDDIAPPLQFQDSRQGSLAQTSLVLERIRTARSIINHCQTADTLGDQKVTKTVAFVEPPKEKKQRFKKERWGQGREKKQKRSIWKNNNRGETSDLSTEIPDTEKPAAHTCLTEEPTVEDISSKIATPTSTKVEGDAETSSENGDSVLAAFSDGLQAIQAGLLGSWGSTSDLGSSSFTTKEEGSAATPDSSSQPSAFSLVGASRSNSLERPRDHNGATANPSGAMVEEDTVKRLGQPTGPELFISLVPKAPGRPTADVGRRPVPAKKKKRFGMLRKIWPRKKIPKSTLATVEEDAAEPGAEPEDQGSSENLASPVANHVEIFSHTVDGSASLKEQEQIEAVSNNAKAMDHPSDSEPCAPITVELIGSTELEDTKSEYSIETDTARVEGRQQVDAYPVEPTSPNSSTEGGTVPPTTNNKSAVKKTWDAILSLAGISPDERGRTSLRPEQSIHAMKSASYDEALSPRGSIVFDFPDVPQSKSLDKMGADRKINKVALLAPLSSKGVKGTQERARKLVSSDSYEAEGRSDKKEKAGRHGRSQERRRSSMSQNKSELSQTTSKCDESSLGSELVKEAAQKESRRGEKERKRGRSAGRSTPAEGNEMDNTDGVEDPEEAAGSTPGKPPRPRRSSKRRSKTDRNSTDIQGGLEQSQKLKGRKFPSFRKKRVESKDSRGTPETVVSDISRMPDTIAMDRLRSKSAGPRVMMQESEASSWNEESLYSESQYDDESRILSYTTARSSFDSVGMRSFGSDIESFENRLEDLQEEIRERGICGLFCLK